MTALGALRSLRRHYEVMNDLAYSGRLTHDVKFKVAECRGLAECEIIRTYADDGSTKRERVVVTVDPRLIWCEKLFVRELLHEVVHIARPDLNHGSEFESEMLRVRTCLGGDQLW